MRTLPFAPRRSLLAAALVLWAAWTLPARAQDDAWALIKQPGHAVFMRHADAPGYGDPPGLRIEDCTTQRNLSEEGRAHARRTGEAFKAHGITFDRVLTSPWCRCRDTAELAVGKRGVIFAPLSNLVGRPEHTDEQVAELKRTIGKLAPHMRMLFVTHGVVIAALTGVSPASGEMVIVKAGPGIEPTVAGRLRVD